MLCVGIANNGTIQQVDISDQACVDQGYFLLVESVDTGGSFQEFLEYTVNAFEPEVFSLIMSSSLLMFAVGWGGALLINALYKARRAV